MNFQPLKTDAMRLDQLLNTIETSSKNTSVYFSIINEDEPITVNGAGGEELQFNDRSQYQQFIKQHRLDTGAGIRLIEFFIKTAVPNH
jgi:hypothetical protein